MEESHLSWQTLEYDEKERGADWYWAVVIISVSLAAAAFIFNNLLFSVLILVGAFTLVMFAKRKPSVVQVELNNKGLRMNKILYLYNDLESFSIEEIDPLRPKLIIKSKKVLMPLIVVPIHDVGAQEVRSALIAKIPEKHHAEPLAHKIFDYLGF